MKNGDIVSEFSRVFLLAPELAQLSLQEALKGKYEVTFKKVVPIRTDTAEDRIFRFASETAEKGIAVL